MSVANRSLFLCCTEDESRSLETSLQEAVSNHLKWLPLRAAVLNVQEKAGKNQSGTCWKGEEHEPHRRCREFIDAVKTGMLSLSWEKFRGNLLTVCSAADVDVARVQHRLQYGTWESVVSMLRKKFKQLSCKNESINAKH